MKCHLSFEGWDSSGSTSPRAALIWVGSSSEVCRSKMTFLYASSGGTSKMVCKPLKGLDQPKTTGFFSSIIFTAAYKTGIFSPLCISEDTQPIELTATSHSDTYQSSSAGPSCSKAIGKKHRFFHLALLTHCVSPAVVPKQSPVSTGSQL